MAIHGITYLIIGIFVVIASWYINNKTGTSKLILFFYVGLFFILIGLIKLIFFRLKSEKKLHHQPNKQGAFGKFCSNCGTALKAIDQFCHNCGNRIFHKK
jgi:energy-coupling factor transporter transmembrane protein EcfT